MPRWKALPDELDPQIREFASRSRRLVDRSGLGVAAMADRTGYGRTSWERYPAGRRLAPRAAVVALAEATGANPAHVELGPAIVEACAPPEGRPKRLRCRDGHNRPMIDQREPSHRAAGV